MIGVGERLQRDFRARPIVDYLAVMQDKYPLSCGETTAETMRGEQNSAAFAGQFRQKGRQHVDCLRIKPTIRLV
jgi:hypothetical protein